MAHDPHNLGVLNETASHHDPLPAGVARRALVAAALSGGIGFVAAASFAPLPDTAHALWTLVLFGLLGALATIDWLTRTVPDALTLALLVTGLLHAASAGTPMLPFAAGAGLLLAIGFLIGACTDDTGWIGSGDYYLAAGILGWVGPIVIIDVLLLASAGLFLSCLLSRARSAAFAPSLAVATAFIWTGGTIL